MTRSLPVLSKLKTRLRPSERPPVAVQVTPGGVLAAAKTSASETVYGFHPLPGGAITVSATQPNLNAPEIIVAAISAALQQVSGDLRSVTLLLPDSATRVFALDFDSLSSNPEEVLAVLRLRLKKIVPFEVDSAKISYQLLAHQGNACKVLAVVVHKDVLSDYEAVVRDAGYRPGAVLPCALSALAAINSDEPMLSAYLSTVSLTTSITAGNNILLYRTHELPEDPAERTAEMQRDVAVAVAYFEDELKAVPSCVHYAGNLDSEEFSRSVLNRPIAVKPYSAEDAALTLPDCSNTAALIGALAGARCAA